MDFSYKAQTIKKTDKMLPVKNFEEAKKKLQYEPKFGMDLHVWIETEEGKILDYSNDDVYYKTVRKIRNLTEERVYHSLNEEDTKRLWKIIYQNEIKPSLKNYKKQLKQQGIPETYLPQIFLQQDSSGCCAMRAYFLHQQDKGTIKIGSMGWKDETGNIWWEYG